MKVNHIKDNLVDETSVNVITHEKNMLYGKKQMMMIQ